MKKPLAVLCSAALLALSATGAVAAPSALRFCAQGSPSNFDPASSDSGIDHIATQPVFSNLLEDRRGTAELMPALADSWTISPDGRSYTFKLRPGVKFHSTAWFKPKRDFNADDVLFTFERLLGLPSPFNKAHPIVSPYVTALGWQTLVQKVEKLDALTVRLQLATVDASFLRLLSYAFAGIESAEYGAQLLAAGKPAQIGQLPIGTGPFAFKSYQKDSLLRYARHADYFRRDRVLAEQLVFAITPDRSVRTQRLKRNECDIAVLSNPADVQELARDPQIQLASVPGLNTGFLAYNLKRPPLDRLAVRQALDMAIDKKALLATIYAGTGELATSPMPRANWAHDETLQPVPHAPEKARALLAQAGVKQLDLTLWAMPVQRAYNPNAQLMAQMIQADWARVGVTARIVSYDWGEYLKRVDRGEHDTALLGWGGDPEPADTAGQLICGAASASFWCDKAYDEAVLQAKQTLDQAQRKKLYAKAQRIAMAALPWSPIAHGRITVALRKNVQGFQLGLDGGIRFDGVTVR